MSIFDNYNQSGKNNIKTTRSDFTNAVGEEGLKDIIKKVLLGGNVRDITEFITQKRLMNSYSALLELFMKHLGKYADSAEDYADYVANDLLHAKSKAKLLDLWLLGVTEKGLQNIVRGKDRIVDYQISFANSLNDTVEDLKQTYGELTGTIEFADKNLDLNWNVFLLMLMAAGSQTLSIRGSSKSMNGKMFEKLVLGTLLSIMGFTYLPEPPEKIEKTEKLFWLSHMDENEREVDATAAYNGKAVSIDIGFIGKGNPEITLDKVTRFHAYKQIGGTDHNMATIIIVDTVGDNSDLFHKAERVNGHVLQMRNGDWTINFAKIFCSIVGCSHELTEKEVHELSEYFDGVIDNMDIQKFVK